MSVHRSLVVVSLALLTPSAVRAQQVEWKAVETAIGRGGAMQPGDVYKFGFPRSDLRVRVGTVAVKPALALGSWVGFKATAGGAVAAGDLVLAESEIAPVMAKLEAGGVEITALHHHLLDETPRVYYMHIHAMGDPVAIATAIHAALALTATPPPSPAAPPAAITLDTAAIAAALGHAGRVNGGVYQVGVARPDTVREGEVVIPPSLGVATSLNFQPLEAGRAATTGDFVLRGAEVNPVVRALLAHGITVTSVHSHMLDEEPRLFFMHFWGVGDAVALARGLRAALDEIK